MKKKDDINRAFLEAVKAKRLKEAEQMIKDGIDVNVKDQYGWSPLISAASNGDVEMVKLLLANRADVNAMTKDGSTAFMFADKSYPEVTAALLANGAANEIGNTTFISEFMTKGRMKSERGWSDRAIKELLGECDKEVDNPHYKCASPMKLYLTERVLETEKKPEFMRFKVAKLTHANAIRQGRELKRILKEQIAAKRYEQYQLEMLRMQAEWDKKYPNPKLAIQDVCDAMLYNNRIAKHSDCDIDTKDSIYTLKNQLIYWLHANGYCMAVKEHSIYHERQACWKCYGSGCERCYGTGVYRPAYETCFYCFTFDVNGKTYSWHQPEHLVNFAIVKTTDDGDMPNIQIKDVPLTQEQLRVGRELVSWFLGHVMKKAA